jgi:hypothetical protein
MIVWEASKSWKCTFFSSVTSLFPSDPKEYEMRRMGQHLWQICRLYVQSSYPPYPLRASNRIFTPNHKGVALLWWRSLSTVALKMLIFTSLASHRFGFQYASKFPVGWRSGLSDSPEWLASAMARSICREMYEFSHHAALRRRALSLFWW